LPGPNRRGVASSALPETTFDMTLVLGLNRRDG